MRVGLTVGHAGRINRLNDRGASFEGIEEVSLIRAYTDALDVALRKLGHECIIFSDGLYSEQWLRVDKMQCDIYFNCHINAGKGDYGLFLHDYRSTKGALLGKCIQDEFKKNLPKYVTKVMPCRPDSNGVGRDGDFSEAYGCIAGVGAVALCLEPYFLDGASREFFIKNPILIGQILATAIHNYSKL